MFRLGYLFGIFGLKTEHTDTPFRAGVYCACHTLDARVSHDLRVANCWHYFPITIGHLRVKTFWKILWYSLIYYRDNNMRMFYHKGIGSAIVIGYTEQSIKRKLRGKVMYRYLMAKCFGVPIHLVSVKG